jgi:subtilisin-like proprotein convertase family protein
MNSKRFSATQILSGIIAGVCFLAAPAPAQFVTNTYNFTVNEAIPDNDLSGASDTQTILPGILSITELSVTLSITGGFNGDYYAYLTHDSGFAVLLNRAGRTATDDFGYPDSGFNVTFEDDAANGDIHSYRLTLNPNGGALTGTWSPDGRDVHPASSIDTTLRDATLVSFQGLGADGDWTLFVADNSSVGNGVFDSWGMTVIGAVPEPGTIALLGLGATILVLAVRRRRHGRYN